MRNAAAESAAQDAASCQAVLAHGSRSFNAASVLLPRRVRDSVAALYAFCRVADDAIDTAADCGAQHAALAALSNRLDAIYAGTPQDFPEDRGFAHAVICHGIPRALPDALLEGFAWDAQGRRYADLPALLEYAARVAGTVGAMMSLVMDARSPATLARACDLGMAMQLSNIARDVGEDARMGRLYLPEDWLREAGVDTAAFLARPVFSPGVRRAVARLLREADRLYSRAAPGIAALPPDCRLAIHVSRRLYQAIGHAAGAEGFDPVEARAMVPAHRKAVLIARALGDRLFPAANRDDVCPRDWLAAQQTQASGT